jgi:hypothetical protein
MKKINTHGIVMLMVLFLITSCKTSYSPNFDKIELYYNEYETIYYIEHNVQINFSLKIISKEKLNILKNSINPLLYVNINNKTIIARGFLSVLSQLPEEGNYFFPVDDNGKIEFFEENTIEFIGFEDRM